MSVPIRVRRPLVILGVMLSLLAGAGSIRAAAEWTAASSPLVAKPPSVESLQASLATEQARSAALQAHLDELTSGSADLATALTAARERIAADTSQAAELQASLEAAKVKLAALEKSIRAARAAANRSAAAPVTKPAAAPTHSGDDGHEEADDD